MTIKPGATSGTSLFSKSKWKADLLICWKDENLTDGHSASTSVTSSPSSYSVRALNTEDKHVMLIFQQWVIVKTPSRAVGGRNMSARPLVLKTGPSTELHSQAEIGSCCIRCKSFAECNCPWKRAVSCRTNPGRSSHVRAE